MTMSPSMCCFSVETSFSTSPWRTVELFQAGWAKVADTTYLGSLSASSPLRDGHRAAGHSSLRRPSRRAPAASASSSASLASCGLFPVGPARPPALRPSSPAGVLDDSVERDVLAHDDLSHFGSAARWSSGNRTLAARPASPPCLAEQPVSFAGPPGVILDGFDEVFVDEHGLLLRLMVFSAIAAAGGAGGKNRCAVRSFRSWPDHHVSCGSGIGRRVRL